MTSLARGFPPGFLWGAATAAYQIEGAHDADGKGPSIWDAFARRPGAISTGETGDVACDHYHRFRDDVRLMAELGLGAYRFSVSWPRVLPDGTGRPNEAGLAFYERLVEALLDHGIRPFVTLYHWDLPITLEERGGWRNPEVAGWFGEYAALVARRLGDRVRDWMTLNEPEVVAFAGHLAGVHAPGMRDERAAVLVSHHLLLAHGTAAEAIRGSAGGISRVGVALNLSPVHPASGAEADAAAALRVDGRSNRWFLDPLFGRGYPRDMLTCYEAIFDRGAEMDGFHGRLDFLGVNYYTRRMVAADPTGPLAARTLAPDGERTAMGWEVYPDGLRELLARVGVDYSPSAIYVTENGAAYDDVLVGGRVDDAARIAFLERHIAAAADAVTAGVPLHGYFVWSLIDNFEWSHGTSKRFGLVHVDYATQRRRVKASGEWYRDLIAAHAGVA